MKFFCQKITQDLDANTGDSNMEWKTWLGNRQSEYTWLSQTCKLYRIKSKPKHQTKMFRINTGRNQKWDFSKTWRLSGLFFKGVCVCIRDVYLIKSPIIENKDVCNVIGQIMRVFILLTDGGYGVIFWGSCKTVSDWGWKWSYRFCKAMNTVKHDRKKLNLFLPIATTSFEYSTSL